MVEGITGSANAVRLRAGAGPVSTGEVGNTDGSKRVPANARVDPEQARLLKLKKAATQFEAMLLEKWWSSMKESGLGEEDDADPGAGTLNTMGMQALSMAVAGAGGIGIAAMLVNSLQGEIATQNDAQVRPQFQGHGSGIKTKSH